MKTTYTMVTLAAIMALGTGSAYAQLGALGGSLGGTANGALGGSSSMGGAGGFNSAGNAGFDSDLGVHRTLDSGRLRDASRDTAHDTTGRTRNLAGKAKTQAGNTSDVAARKTKRTVGNNDASADAGITPSQIGLGGSANHESASRSNSASNPVAASTPSMNAPAPSASQAQATTSSSQEASASASRN